ncbi:hypothetical protein J6590_037081 [Homalodisca vitripennis]|nr:hypothetical protein J6590_037081 [Homalodisca vitripennis]
MGKQREKYSGLKVSYTSYWLIFRQDFNLKFGQPQIDTCCVCESLSVKIKRPHLNEAAKRAAIAESIVHKRKAKKYYACIQQEVEDKNNKVNENILAIAIDYICASLGYFAIMKAKPKEGQMKLAHSTMVQVQLPTSSLYSELGAPLKLNKIIDIEKALPYVPDEHQDYYENLLANSMALFTGNEDE